MKKNIKKKLKTGTGFSLVEVLLAVVLLAIVVTPLLQAVVTSMNLNRKSRILLGATDVGQSAVEYFESLTYGDIKTLLENNGNNVSISAINFVGKSVDESGSWYGGNTEATTSAQLKAKKETWTLFSELCAYSKIQTGKPDRYISYQSTDVFDFYAINKVQSNGFDYDLVVFITPLYDGTKYDLYEVQVDVYYNDYKNSSNIHGGHDKKNLMASFKGSVFNKFD